MVLWWSFVKTATHELQEAAAPTHSGTLYNGDEGKANNRARSLNCALW